MYGMFLLGVGTATTSCEDMFTADNNLVTTDLAPKDTLYQMMGILKSMQKLGDRTVLLGEIRADLIDIDPNHSSKDLQELANNTVSFDNVYNKPADYYAVINNCNVYLANVDSMRNSQGTEKYYMKEICAAKCFRAWAYLELLKNYGKVPFVTEPVLTSDAAEDIVANEGSYADMQTILDFCIEDLKGYAYLNKNQELRQAYGNQTYYGMQYKSFFLPVRVVLAELYLWRGSYSGNKSDYINAARMYHDYFTFSNEEVAVDATGTAEWMDYEFRSMSVNYYLGFNDDDYEAVIPMDTTTYYGVTSGIRAVFNSSYGNDYYPAAIPSKQLEAVSKSQRYCLHESTEQGDTCYYNPTDVNHYGTEKARMGDLRYYCVYGFNTRSNFAESKYNSNFSPTIYAVAKYGTNTTDLKKPYIGLYRKNILYLHMAEALNRAGFPETAFAVLKYGLSRYVMDNNISEDEFNRLCEIKSWGFSPAEPLYLDKQELSSKANGSFVIWPSTVFGTKITKKGTPVVEGNQRNIQIGIHAFGSGNVEVDNLYYLDDAATLANLQDTTVCTAPTPPDETFATEEEIAQYEADLAAYQATLAQNAEIVAANKEYLASPEVRAKRQARVSQLLLEEEILEGMFEGYRFYDLLRFQMQEQGGTGIGTVISLPAHYIGNELYQGTVDKLQGKPWYLPLPKR